jgi:hypothetical protein
LRAPPRLELPRERRTAWPALAASLLAHAVLLAVVVSFARVQMLVVESVPEVRVAELQAVPVELPAEPLPPAEAAPQATRPRPEARVRVEASRAAQPVSPLSEQRESAARDSSGVRPGAVPGAAAAEPLPGRIGAAMASGKLWIRPLPMPPKELAARLTGTPGELADSVVTRVIQAFLDSIAADPASRNAEMPSWTTNIAGAKFGLDSKWIHVAGLKIPAALLALLPIPFGGNEQRAFDRSEWLYEDLRQASQRSDNLAEFKKTIKEIRERKEAEREFQRNQRTPPEEEPTLQPLAP